MKKVCVCFCRVSTQQQDLEQQTNAIISEGEKMGYDRDHQIIIQYKESGVLLSANEREGIDKLKESILKNRDIDCVICWELSRIARRADIIYNIRDFFLEHHIQWIVLNPYMRLLENDGKMSQTSSIMLALFTSLAESEMEIKKERFKRGKKRAKELGRFSGGLVPFGYSVNKEGFLVIEENSASVVGLLFRMYASGKYSLLTMSRELKDLGYFDSFTTIPAIRTFIYKILKEKKYYGEDIRRPPIISKTLFDEVQIKLKENYSFKYGNVKDMLCRQLLFDDQGYCMTGINREKNGVDNIYCSNLYSGYKCSIAQKGIDPFVWQISKGLYKRYFMNESILQKQQEEKNELLNKKYVVAKEKITKIQGMIDRTEERYIKGCISRDKVESIIESLKEELKEWTNKKLYYMEQLKELSERIKDIEVKKRIDLDKLPFEERYDIVRCVIERMVIQRPVPRTFIAHIEVYPKVNDNVYRYEIKTPCGCSRRVPTWKKIGVRKRREGDIIDLSRKWNHIPINIPPLNNQPK